MLEKFRTLYNKSLIVKITTVVLVVILSMSIMLPITKVAELFGVNLLENNGLNLEVDFANFVFFVLFIVCSTLIIWAAQKYIHQSSIVDLGFRGKIFGFLLIGFLIGAIKSGTGYGLMALSAGSVKFNSVIPENVSLWSYTAFYLYFITIIIFNSFIEELVTRAYPIEALKKHFNPHIIFIIMGIIFTVGHFFTREFDLGYCLSLFIYSYTFSLLYHYSNSIWLVIGMHNGVNWLGFSFFGTNWKLGALVHTEIFNAPDWVASFIQPIIGILLLFIIVYLHKKGIFKKFCS
jgi:membrane protease YdiL (CAAX protease family)